jgi:hypothetical protein
MASFRRQEADCRTQARERMSGPSSHSASGLADDGHTTPTEFTKREIATYCASYLDELKIELGADVNSPAIPTTSLGEALSEVGALESSVGQFHIWSSRPGLAYCGALIRAGQSSEQDFEDYLAWFCETKLAISANPKHDEINQLRAYVAHALLGTRTIGGKLCFPGDLSNLAHLPDRELYSYLPSAAKARAKEDYDTSSDRVRLTVGKTENGEPIRRVGKSLDAEDKNGVPLGNKVPAITRDPIELLCSSREPVKLVDLAAMRAELAADPRWSRLNLTLDEYRYHRLHHGFGMTQAEIGQYMNLDAQKLQAIRRNADLKVQKYREAEFCQKQTKLNHPRIQ